MSLSLPLASFTAFDFIKSYLKHVREEEVKENSVVRNNKKKKNKQENNRRKAKVKTDRNRKLEKKNEDRVPQIIFY